MTGPTDVDGLIVVHLVRHGEVDNPDRVLYGRLPGFHLSDLGKRQAQAAADWFAGHDIGQLTASPLERAQQTAALVAERTGLPVSTDERLLEADNFLQGRHVAGGRGLFRDPANWRYFVNPFKPSWGEPYRQIADRMLAAARAARDAAAAAGRAEAVCVSHQLPIVAVRRDVQGRPLFHDPRRRQCALGSITSLTFAGDSVTDVAYVEPAPELPSGLGAGA
jgi:broad specificity phosphatase PhoE